MGEYKEASPSAERLTGYRYSATGVFGYEFYRGRAAVCAVSGLVAPSARVVIRGYGKSWESGPRAGSSESGADGASPRGAGPADARGQTVKYVYDCAGREPVGRLAYEDMESCLINGSVRAVRGGEGFAFYSGEKLIARMERLKEKHAWVPERPEYDWEPYFDVVFKTEVDDGLRLMMLALPMLWQPLGGPAL